MTACSLVEVGVPLDLGRTLAKLGGSRDQDGWWRPARTPEGPATLRVSRTAAGVRGEAWGEGARWMLDRLPDVIGLGDRPEDLHTDHPVVAPLARRLGGARFGRTGLVVEAAMEAILAQKVTGREAAVGSAGLRRRFSGPAPGPRPDLRLPPDPERVAAAPYWDFHDLGIERRRAEALRRVAARARRIEGLSEQAPVAARSFLERLPGVGEWTSAETVAISHGDADAVAVGDFHLKHLVSWHLAGRPRGTDGEMLELLEPFRPHRGRVIRLLVTRGYAPAFGPRVPLRDFRAN